MDKEPATIVTTMSDPTALTQERIEREVSNTHIYIDGKFATLEQRLDGIDKASEVLAETVNRYPTDIDKAVKALEAVLNEKLIAEKETGLKREETFEKRLKDIYNLTDNRFVTLRTVIDSNSEKVALALDASEKAIIKAENAADKRFENVNGFQKQLTDLGNQMATRRELEQTMAEIKGILAEHSKQLTEMRSRLDVGPSGLETLQTQYTAFQGERRGTDITMSKIYAAIGAVGAILGIIILLANGVFK